MLSRRTPLAWRNLTADPRRLAASLAGVVFAIILMFMQRGFQRALLDSTVEALRRLDGDLALLSKSRFMLGVNERFPRRRIYQAAAIPGVAGAVPIYLESLAASWKNVESGAHRNIRVIAYPVDADALRIPEIVEQRDKLRELGAALMDSRSKPKYGPREVGTETELAGKRLKIVGFFRLGSDFANDGNLVMSDRSFLHYFPQVAGEFPSEAAKVDIGLIRAAPNVDIGALRSTIESLLPNDVKVLTVDEFIASEQAFWDGATPIGFVFGMGTALGLVVGTIVCYQILFGDVVRHLKEFATMKAMGYRNLSLFRVVMEQSLLVATMGFAVGAPLSILLYRLLGQLTGLIFRPTLADAALVFALSAAMCVAAGCVAIRRLFKADPAELFA